MSTYTTQEYANMHLIYGECRRNSSAAARLYRERFPNAARYPDDRVFRNVHSLLISEGRLPSVPNQAHSEGTEKPNISIEMMAEKPKRPMSAYMLWLNSERGKLKAKYPGLNDFVLAKKAGELWRSMDDKTTWEEKSAVARKQYARDMERFNDNGGASPPKKALKRSVAQAKPGNVSRSKVQKEASEDEHDDSECNIIYTVL